MKSLWTKTMKTVVIMVALAGSLTACQQKKDDSPAFTKGSMSTDGASVVSNTNFGGYPLAMGMSNIVAGGVATQQTSNGYMIGNQGIALNTYTFDLYINGSTKRLNTVPTVYNPAWAMSGYQVQSQMASDYIGGYQVLFESRCNSQACENLYINVVLQTQNGTKQFGIRKDGATIFNMIEHDSYTNSLRTMEVLMMELNAK